jgi:dihydroorotase
MTKSGIEKVVLKNPFDAHMHWRQLVTLLYAVAKYSTAQFSGGLLMPNTSPYLTNMKNLLWYIGEIKEYLRKSNESFFPIFTFYLSSELQVDELLSAWNDGLINGVKYYPKGGTTGSDKGLVGFSEVRHILEAMEKHGIPLLIHGETPVLNDEVVDDYEREEVFLETEMTLLITEFPELQIVLEHITTKAAANFVLEHKNVRATITPQHCLLDRRAKENGIKMVDRSYRFDIKKNGHYPSMDCRPVLKHLSDVLGIQAALIYQAKHGLKKFGLGTDTAPHTADKKNCECGACGVFSAPIALELYAMAFEQMGILEHLPVFACEIMPEFYGIKDKLPNKTIILLPEPKIVQPEYEGIVTPFSNLILPWTAVNQN